MAYLRPYKGIFGLGMGALLVTSLLNLSFPYFLSQLFAGGTEGMREPTEVVLERLDRVALSLLAVLFALAVFAYWRITLFARSGERAMADMRRDVYSRLVCLPMSFFVTRRVGELTSRLSADLTLIHDALVTIFPQMVRQVVMLIGGVCIIVVVSWKLTLFMLACLPVIVLVTVMLGRRIRRYSRVSQDALAETSVVAEETLQGIFNVKAFGNESFETRRYRSALDRFLDVVIRAAKARGLFVSFIMIALLGSASAVVWYGSRMVGLEAISMEEFTKFVFYTVFVGMALGTLPDLISQIQRAVGATDRVRDLLEEEAEKLDEEVGRQGRLQGAFAFENVSFSYPSQPDVPVLRGITLEAKPGQRIALVGPSGAGKSTLTQLLLRFYDPDDGMITYDGEPYTDFGLAYLRSQMAVVPQEVLLFGGSIRENIAYGRPGASEEDIRQAAARAHADKFIESCPQGYETIVGDRGIRLSGGQRQRIAIARALLADPALLILDEATSALDSESEHAVQLALEELMRGRTSIIIAHRLSTIRTADCIYVMKGGRIVQQGTHDGLRAEADGLYRLLSDLQLQE